MAIVATYPDSTKTSLEQRLAARARERWPQIASLHIRHRGTFSYIDATLTDATTLKLCRLRYVGSAHQWQFAIYRASHDDYDESIFPHRPAHRHLPRRPRHRLRPLPQRPNRLGLTPGELTGKTTNAVCPVGSEAGVAAVCDEDGAGDEGGGVAGEEDDGGRELLDRAVPLERSVLDPVATELRLVDG